MTPDQAAARFRQAFSEAGSSYPELGDVTFREAGVLADVAAREHACLRADDPRPTTWCVVCGDDQCFTHCVYCGADCSGVVVPPAHSPFCPHVIGVYPACPGLCCVRCGEPVGDVYADAPNPADPDCVDVCCVACTARRAPSES